MPWRLIVQTFDSCLTEYVLGERASLRGKIVAKHNDDGDDDIQAYHMIAFVELALIRSRSYSQDLSKVIMD